MGWIADLLQEIPSAARYKSELEVMEKKVISLEAENVNLRQEIQRRDDVIQKEKSHSGHLEEIKEKVLVLLSKKKEVREEEIIQHLAVSAQLAAFHLADLKTSNLIYNTTVLFMMGNSPPTTYSLTQEGRRYLVTHGLIA